MAVEACFGSCKLVFIGVYFLCFVTNDDYEARILMIVGFIESIFEAYKFCANSKFIILGDFNFNR